MAFQLLEQIGASPETYRIEICSGYINQPLREALRKHGYDVRVVEIKGMLQEQLEKHYREYIFDEIGVDIYYDPKQLDHSGIARSYEACVNYGTQNCPEKIKTGWSALRQIGNSHGNSD